MQSHRLHRLGEVGNDVENDGLCVTRFMREPTLKGIDYP